jgi:hypothetical protein
MTDAAPPSPLDVERFVPPRAQGVARVAGVNGNTIPVPGPGAPETPHREEIMRGIIRLLMNGTSLTKALRQLHEKEGLPLVEPNTVGQWAHRHPHFAEAYRVARAWGSHVKLDQADDALDEAVDRDSSLAARVKAEGRIKLAQAWNPSEFGPRVAPQQAVQVTLITSLPPPDRQNTDGVKLIVDAPPEQLPMPSTSGGKERDCG